MIFRPGPPNSRQADGVFVRLVCDYALCNFKCPYCITSKFQERYRQDHEWHERNYRTIITNLTRVPFPVNVRLGVRGEFFLSETLLDGARSLSRADNCVSVNLISNLSFGAERYDRLLGGFDLDKVALVASYHPTEIRDVERWIETARHLAKRIDFSVVLVAYPPLLRDLAGSVEMLRGQGFEVAVQGYIGLLNGKEYPHSYSEAEKSMLREVVYSRHDYEHWFNLKQPGWCNSGYKSMYVNTETGIVLSCGMGGGRVLGNLLRSPEVQLAAGPARCPNRTCLCDTENMNTVQFEQHYVRIGINQHKYRYRRRSQALADPSQDEWQIDY